MHIFISHSSKEAEAAKRICEILEENGKKCFLAPRDIRAGREYAEEIINGIDQSETMLLLMSEAANRSPHVLREVERAVSKSIPILVYKLEEVELSKSMEYFLMTHQWVNAKVGTDYREITEYLLQQEDCGQSDIERKEISKQKDSESKPLKSKTKKKRKSLFLIFLLIVLLLVGAAFWGVSQFSGQTGLFRKKEPNLQVGDTVTLGTYNGKEISWRVLKMSEDGSEAVLIAEKILTMKAYDAAEGGKYNSDGTNDYWHEGTEADTNLELQILVRGNNNWSTSNIRTWLNSSAEVVQYEDQAPVATAMSELHNGYQNEPGFLYGFTEEELSVIVENQTLTKGNALTAGEDITTTDKVYLLSKDELQWFTDAGISMLAVPTQAAIEQDDSGWYQIYSLDYGVEEYLWWLRTPVEGSASQCYLVGNGYLEDNIYAGDVDLEGFGIRPAITVDACSDIFDK